MLGQADRSISELQAILKKEPKMIQACMDLARVYEKLGRIRLMGNGKDAMKFTALIRNCSRPRKARSTRRWSASGKAIKNGKIFSYQAFFLVFLNSVLNLVSRNLARFCYFC
jgi:hypothetical protein